jgi:hypothetical protein
MRRALVLSCAFPSFRALAFMLPGAHTREAKDSLGGAGACVSETEADFTVGP